MPPCYACTTQLIAHQGVQTKCIGRRQGSRSFLFGVLTQPHDMSLFGGTHSSHSTSAAYTVLIHASLIPSVSMTFFTGASLKRRMSRVSPVARISASRLS